MLNHENKRYESKTPKWNKAKMKKKYVFGSFHP